MCDKAQCSYTDTALKMFSVPLVVDYDPQLSLKITLQVLNPEFQINHVGTEIFFIIQKDTWNCVISSISSTQSTVSKK